MDTPGSNKYSKNMIKGIFPVEKFMLFVNVDDVMKHLKYKDKEGILINTCGCNEIDQCKIMELLININNSCKYVGFEKEIISIVICKMDIVPEERQEIIYKKCSRFLLNYFNIDVPCIPISALNNINVLPITTNDKSGSYFWYKGKSILETVEEVTKKNNIKNRSNMELRVTITRNYRKGHSTGFQTTGTLEVGQTVYLYRFASINEKNKLTYLFGTKLSITNLQYNNKNVKKTYAGTCIGIKINNFILLPGDLLLPHPPAFSSYSKLYCKFKILNNSITVDPLHYAAPASIHTKICQFKLNGLINRIVDNENKDKDKIDYYLEFPSLKKLEEKEEYTVSIDFNDKCSLGFIFVDQMENSIYNKFVLRDKSIIIASGTLVGYSLPTPSITNTPYNYYYNNYSTHYTISPYSSRLIGHNIKHNTDLTITSVIYDDIAQQTNKREYSLIQFDPSHVTFDLEFSMKFQLHYEITSVKYFEDEKEEPYLHVYYKIANPIYNDFMKENKNNKDNKNTNNSNNKIIVKEVKEMNIIDNKYETPMTIGIKEGFTKKQIEKLYNKGINMKITSKTTGIHYSIIVNNMDACIFFIELGIDINSKTTGDVTPLHTACQYNNFPIVNYLITHNADINCIDSLNRTPLHYSWLYSSTSIVELLLSNGATLFNGNNITNNHVSLEKTNIEIERKCLLFQIYGISIDTTILTDSYLINLIKSTNEIRAIKPLQFQQSFTIDNSLGTQVEFIVENTSIFVHSILLNIIGFVHPQFLR